MDCLLTSKYGCGRLVLLPGGGCKIRERAAHSHVRRSQQSCPRVSPSSCDQASAGIPMLTGSVIICTRYEEDNVSVAVRLS